MTSNIQKYNRADSELVKSSLPSFRDRRKVDFLVLRSVSFTTEEALQMVGVARSDYEGWKVYDQAFKLWEEEKVWELQKHVGSAVLRSRFMRNVFLQLHVDNELLTQRAFDPGSMSGDEREEAREAAKRYNASHVAQMLKVLDEDTVEKDEATIKVELKVDVGAGGVESYIARKAAARLLLNKFSKQNLIDNDSGTVLEDEE